MSGPPYRLLVTGSRDWSRCDPAYHRLRYELMAAHSWLTYLVPAPVTVVHGNSGDVDRTCAAWAKAGRADAWTPPEPHDPDWCIGRAAGPMRNARAWSPWAPTCAWR